MKTLLRLMTLAVFVVSINLVVAEPARTLKSEAEARALSDKAMKDAVRGNYKKAFARFKPYWPLGEKQINVVIANINQGMQKIHQRYGKSIGFQFIEAKRREGLLVRFVYVQKFEFALVRWVFIYYKPNKHWHVLSVSTDDNYEALID